MTVTQVPSNANQMSPIPTNTPPPIKYTYKDFDIVNSQMKAEDLNQFLHRQPKKVTEGQNLYPYINYYKNKGYVKNGYRYSKTPPILRLLHRFLKHLTPSPKNN